MKVRSYEPESAPPRAGDPRAAVAELEQLLASNSGEDAFDVAMRLLAAKLVDEVLARETGRAPRFTAQPPSARHLGVVTELYRDASLRWPGVGGSGPGLGITPEQLCRCMRPLIGWRMLDTDLAHLDAALERLVARDAKGELGQYFTPRDVVRLCVAALNPRSGERVIDPACGSGAFLFEAVRHVMSRRGEAPPACLGIDFGARSVRVAHLLSNAICPGAITVSKANSLDGRADAGARPAEWDAFLSSRREPAPPAARPWGAWHRLSGSVVLTNPPFAGEVDEPDVLAAYESQRLPGTPRRASASREHLFLERAVQLLTPGGRLAIVLPQGLLANPTAAYLRRWILTRCRLLAAVGLHPHAFIPYTSVKTALLFLERLAPDEVPPPDYRVLFATSTAPGKDSGGRATGDSDYARIGATLAKFFVAEQRPWAAEATGGAGVAAETVSIREVVAHDRFDAEFYGHEIRRLCGDVTGRASGRIGDVVDRAIGRFRPVVRDIDYVDISSVDAKTGTAAPIRMRAAEAPSRARYLLRPGDVLVSTVRPDRNTVALIASPRDVPLVASSGFCVLRATGVPPEVLYAYCRTDAFRRLLARHATASMYPAVTDRDVLEMPFVAPPAGAARAIVREVQAGRALLERAKTHVSRAIAVMDGVAERPAARPPTTKRPRRRPR
jgi:hypothetical protein